MKVHNFRTNYQTEQFLCISMLQGEEEAENFIRDFIIVNLVSCDIDQIYHITNPMSDLVRLLAERGQGEPEPRLLDQQGADTVMACYTVGIYSDKILIGKCE